MTPPVLVEVADGMAVVTLDRPEVRNALSGALISAVRSALIEADADPSVAAIVLTGSDPAFCAGLDLKALAAGDPDLIAAAVTPSTSPLPRTTKPLIGAVNGACVTGGLELALACDFLVASDRATFADTHARVGVMPGWGLTVQLPLAVGRRTATWMSLTGRPLGAQAALAAGLVAEVIDHDRLLDRARELGRDIASADKPTTSALLATYRDGEADAIARGFERETAAGLQFREGHDPFVGVAGRREAIVARGRRLHEQDQA